MHSTGSTASAIVCRQRCTSSMTNCLSLEEALSSSWASRLSPGLFGPPAGRPVQRVGGSACTRLGMLTGQRRPVGWLASEGALYAHTFHSGGVNLLQGSWISEVPLAAGTSVDAAALGAAPLEHRNTDRSARPWDLFAVEPAEYKQLLQDSTLLHCSRSLACAQQLTSWAGCPVAMLFAAGRSV